ncbi:hypothetical protein ACFLWD_01895 [Chloroflexota bacterium]
MNKKFSKIFGVALTLVMVLSMTVVFAAPAAAEEEAWSAYDIPVEGVAGDWFMTDTIVSLGPIAEAINGDLYLYMDNTAVADDDLYKSEDGGRTWEATEYDAEVGAGAAIVDMVCSSEDAELVYVATATNVYMTDEGGDVDSWAEVGAATIPGAPPITSMDVGYSSDTPYIYIGLSTIGAYAGEVHYLEDAAWARTWIDLNLLGSGLANPSLDVLSVGCSPFFEDDTEVDVLVSDAVPYTAVVNNIGGSVAVWTEVAEAQLGDTVAFRAISASDICYVDDFDEEYEFFVGVQEATSAGLGDVFRFGETLAYDLGVDDDIWGLDVTGGWSSTSLLAGSVADTTAARPTIYYSTDDGDSWDDAADVGQVPAVEDDAAGAAGIAGNFVIIDDDFADSGAALCITELAAAANDISQTSVSITSDFGDTWDAISMIDTDIAVAVHDVAIGGTADDPLFMITEGTGGLTRSVFEYDGTNWERVFLCRDVAAAGLAPNYDLDLVAISPDFATDEAVFLADSAVPVILYSHDAATTFTAMTRNPVGAIDSWAVIDYETIITGDAAGDYYKTDRYGRRTWDTDSINLVANDITDIAVSPNYLTDGTLLAGDDSSLVYISTDEGETWDELSESELALLLVTAVGPTYVAFDADYANNGFVYVASDDVVARCEIDSDLDMDEQAFEDFAGSTTAPALLTANGPGGMVATADGMLYVADVVAGGGIFRCLNPTDDLVEIDWENPVVGLAGAETFTGIGASGYESNLKASMGSNILWGMDSAVIGDIWSYEDTLVGPPSVSLPGDGAFLPDEDRAAFNWDDVNADTVGQYEIEIYEEQDWIDESGVLAVVAGNPTDSEFIETGLTAGTVYVWRVRVDIASPVASRWSEGRTFTTKVGQAAAPVNVRPEPGAQEIILKPTFDWLEIVGADTYRIEIADNTDFSPLITSGTSAFNVWVSDTELDYSTTYFWSVSGVSAMGASVGDPIISVFTTMDEPAAVAPPVIVQDAPSAPDVVIPPAAAPITPTWIYVIIGVGAALAIAVIVLIVRTRRVT